MARDNSQLSPQVYVRCSKHGVCPRECISACNTGRVVDRAVEFANLMKGNRVLTPEDYERFKTQTFVNESSLKAPRMLRDFWVEKQPRDQISLGDEITITAPVVAPPDRQVRGLPRGWDYGYFTGTLSKTLVRDKNGFFWALLETKDDTSLLHDGTHTLLHPQRLRLNLP